MKTEGKINVPHPFPYQGSKRGIAKYILPHFPSNVRCLIEPFCGSGAISIAAAAHGIAERFALNDLNEPLMGLWSEILSRPGALCDEYEKQWLGQQPDRKSYFDARSHLQHRQRASDRFCAAAVAPVQFFCTGTHAGIAPAGPCAGAYGLSPELRCLNKGALTFFAPFRQAPNLESDKP